MPYPPHTAYRKNMNFKSLRRPIHSLHYPVNDTSPQRHCRLSLSKENKIPPLIWTWNIDFPVRDGIGLIRYYFILSEGYPTVVFTKFLHLHVRYHGCSGEPRRIRITRLVSVHRNRIWPTVIRFLSPKKAVNFIILVAVITRYHILGTVARQIYRPVKPLT